MANVDVDGEQRLDHARLYTPDSEAVERLAPDHLPVDALSHEVVKIRVAIIRAKVTAYTPLDHIETRPDWCDGLVAWHPNGRKRRVAHHPYGLATDWAQFPGGSTFIRVPGYMDQTFAQFPENFRIVDDACGQSRKARRAGKQPIIDVRYLTKYSALRRWGARQLDVEVVFSDNQEIPSSLRPWLVAERWQYYRDGKLIATEQIN